MSHSLTTSGTHLGERLLHEIFFRLDLWRTNDDILARRAMSTIMSAFTALITASAARTTALGRAPCANDAIGASAHHRRSRLVGGLMMPKESVDVVQGSLYTSAVFYA